MKIIVCPYCDTQNRVPATKPAGSAVCGECHRPLFTGHPVALDGARFERHLAQSDIPLLVDFWAAWCGPCRVFAPEFERSAPRLEPRVRLLEINIDEEPQLAARLAVQSVPTIALFLHGRELGRFTGAVSETMLAEWVARHYRVTQAG